MSKEENVERKVYEVRRTTMVPKVESSKFVFELHGDEWHVHFAAATNYSLQDMKEIVAIMETMPMDGTGIDI